MRSLTNGSVRARNAMSASKSSGVATSSKRSIGGKIVETSLTDRFHARRLGESRALFSGDASGDYQARAEVRCAKVWYKPIMLERMISSGIRPAKMGAVLALETQASRLSSLCGKRTLIAS